MTPVAHPWRCSCGAPDCPTTVAARNQMRAAQERQREHARLLHELDGSRPMRRVTRAQASELRRAGWTPARDTFIDSPREAA